MNPIRIYLGDDEVWSAPSADTPYQVPEEAVAAGALVQSSTTQSLYSIGDRIDLSRAANVREEASLTGRLIGVNLPGWRGTIASEPVDGPNGTRWYSVEFDRGMWNGYVLDDNFTALPADAEVRRTPGYFQVGDTVELFRDSYARTDQDFNSTTSVIKVIPVNTTGTIIAGPNRDSTDALWYRIEFNDDDETTGWMVSDNYLPGYTAPTFSSDGSWFRWMMQSPAGYNNPATRGLSGIQPQFMMGIDMSPQDDTKILIGEDVSGVWRCTGRDSSGRLYWEHAPCAGLQNRSIPAVASDPTNSNTWLIAGSNSGVSGGTPGIYRTTDYGNTFSRRLSVSFLRAGGGDAEGGMYRYTQRTIVFVKGTNVVYFLNGGGGGFYTSNDRGVSWSQTASGGAVNAIGRVREIDYNPSNRSTVWAAGSGGLFRSNNAGQSWSRVQNGLPGGSITSVQVNPQNGNQIRVCAWANGVWESNNGGSSFSRVHAYQAGKVDSCLVPGYWNRYMVLGINTGAGAGNGSVITRGSGFQNVNVNAPIFGWDHPDFPRWHHQIRTSGISAAKQQAMTGFRWSHQNPDRVVGQSRCVFYHNRTGYNNFENASIGYDGTGWGQCNISSLAETPDGSTMALAIFDYGVYLSQDAGKTWTRRGAGDLGLGATGTNCGVAINPQKNGQMIAAAGYYTRCSIARTSNWGQSWPTNLLSHPYRNCQFVAWNNANPSICYSDKMRSTNGGASWSVYPGANAWGYSPTNHNKVIGVSPSNGNVVWAWNGRTIFRSTNAGQSWTNYHTTNANRNSLLGFESFWPDPTDDRRAFYVQNGVRRINADGSATNLGLNNINQADRLRTDWRDPNVIYVLTRNNGGSLVWATGNGGQNWIDFTENMVRLASVRTIEVLRSGDLMYGGTCGPGIRQGLGNRATSKLRPGGDFADIVWPRVG